MHAEYLDNIPHLEAVYVLTKDIPNPNGFREKKTTETKTLF